MEIHQNPLKIMVTCVATQVPASLLFSVQEIKIHITFSDRRRKCVLMTALLQLWPQVACRTA